MGSEGYFDWREIMERRQQENAWHWGEGEITCSNGPGGMSQSLNYTGYDKLTPTSTSTTTSGGSGQQGGFMVPKFSTYDGTNDPFDHIMHYRQLMTLDIGNDALLCKVFPTSVQGQSLSWLHRLPMNSMNNFWDLSKAFMEQYLCSAQHRENINTLQNIKMQENESLREFVKRFGQDVLQIESCSMDTILQIFKRSICPGYTLFESLAEKPSTMIDDLFKRANKYSMLEDDVRAANQHVLVTSWNARNESTESSKSKHQHRKTGKRQDGQQPAQPNLTLLSISYYKLLSMIQDLFNFRWLEPIKTDPKK
ncbi:hypothetical protein AAG906_017089 [Vitis piasezkii]